MLRLPRSFSWAGSTLARARVRTPASSMGEADAAHFDTHDSCEGAGRFHVEAAEMTGRQP